MADKKIKITDTERLNWLSKQITADEILMPLSEYGGLTLLEITETDSWSPKSIRQAIDAAMRAQEKRWRI